MDSSEIHMVNTCGVCEMIVDRNETSDHPCMEGYTRIYFDKNCYFYPMCENGSIIRRSDLGNNIEAVVEDIDKENDEPTTVTKLTAEPTDIEELLIEEISRREILYNYNLLITQRSRLVINEQWQQVSTALNGQLSTKEAQKKWKILRDTFCRKITEDTQPSGAAGSAKKKKWKHFDRMLFLRNTLNVKKTTTNLEPSKSEETIAEPLKRKRNSETKEEAAMHKIADALTTFATPTQSITLPPPPMQDDVDRLFLIIGNQLRRLTEARKNALNLEIIQFVHKKLSS